MATSGNTSSQDNSSFFGQNAGVPVNRNSRVTVLGGSIPTTGGGANGLFACGAAAFASMTGGLIIATDRGGGTIWVSGGKIVAHGQDSPGIYSTGDIGAENARFVATGSEGAVIESRNSIVLRNCEMSGARKCGVMIYQSFSGDADGGTLSPE